MAALVMGTSYYKAAPAGRVATDFPLTPEARGPAELSYGPGLGEFYVRNGLEYPPRLAIEADSATAASAPSPSRGRAQAGRPRAVVAFGGGKDSHVASAIVAAAGGESERVSVILSDAVGARLQTMSESEIVFIRRTIDPRLIALSRAGAVLNGHIPITGVNSTLLALYAAARELDWVVFANERAASEATLIHHGHEVNHQFSKSLAFEDGLRAAFASAGAGLEYFSVLRPVSELFTAHWLAVKTPEALPIFASCNRNFVFAGEGALPQGRRWCGACAKCVYTAVLLAPFLDPDAHAAVFQSRPLHNPANLEHAREIAGLTGAKPWECVGETREVAAAFARLGALEDWRGVPVVAAVNAILGQRWTQDELARTWAGALDARSEHRLPEAAAAVIGGNR